MPHAYCAELARSEGEPMAGTADVVDVWIMLEYAAAWRAKATTDNALAAPTKAWLKELSEDIAGRAMKPRLQFIRRPEIDRNGGVTLMLGAADGLRRVEVPDYDALSALTFDAIAALPLETVTQYFVCTNGQRDVCCARLGLPTYAALRERVGERVWQTTHVGGHRFAPNVLTLPQAVLYGRVQASDVREFVDTVERGCLAVQWLRGRTRYPGDVQAAEAALAARGFDVSGTMTRQTLDDGGYRVAFGSHAVAVRPGAVRQVLTSCGEERKPVTPWEVSEIGR
jgi:hypothetical protein